MALVLHRIRKRRSLAIWKAVIFAPNNKPKIVAVFTHVSDTARSALQMARLREADEWAAAGKAHPLDDGEE